ncbi:MAG: hypothetical protein IPM07_02710 [Anaerolineales bacterium]|nr:hypothetical protein [Anaerolineales bacterium]
MCWINSSPASLPLEHELLVWLAIVREPVSYKVLRNLLAKPPAPHLMLEAMRSLQRRSLLERYGDGFGLQNVVMEYTTDLLVENMVGELADGNNRLATGRTKPDHSFSLSSPHPVISYLNRYALILAQSNEYVCASQTRLLLHPVAERLVAQLGAHGAGQQLKKLLARLRELPLDPGYAAANLLHLLLQLNVDSRGYDFSRLHLRQLCLRGVSLPQANFARAEIIDSVFTEPFGLVYTARFSPDGRYLAAGTSEGAIYIWRTEDQQLAQVIQAHSQAVQALSFEQRTTAMGDIELALVCAGDDKTVDLWSSSTDKQFDWRIRLSHPQQKSVLSVGSRPNGQRVTSVDEDGQVFVWDLDGLEDSRLVQHFVTTPTRLCFVAHSGDGETIIIGNRDGTVQFHNVATGKMILALTVETGSITSLALSADGRLPATGGKAGHLCLWTLPTGALHQVIESKPTAIDALAFSPDGKMLASAHGVGDHAIRVWTIDAQARLRLRHTLLGHTHTTWSVAFGPSPQPERAENRVADRQLLVSGGSDQTVRVWDAGRGQALYTLRGQPRALAALTIHPKVDQAAGQEKEWLLAAVGYDHFAHLWRGQSSQVKARSLILGGSRSALYAVAISPDGCTVAGAGYDKTIYLWDIPNRQLRHKLQGHTGTIASIAFHPDGKLLASGAMDGTLRLWNVFEPGSSQEHFTELSLPGQPVAVLQSGPHSVDDVAFSPSGCILASVGSDLAVRMWDMTQSHRPELVAARKTVQEEGEQEILAVDFSRTEQN